MDISRKKADGFYLSRRFKDALPMFLQLRDSGELRDEFGHYQLGMCYFNTRSIEEALDSFNASLHILPTKEGFLMKALCLFRMGELRFAAEAFNRFAEFVRVEGGGKHSSSLNIEDRVAIGLAFERLEFEPRPLKLSRNQKLERKKTVLPDSKVRERVQEMFDEGRDPEEIARILDVGDERVEAILDAVREEEEEEFEEFKRLREKLASKRRGKNLHIKEVETRLEEGQTIQEIADALDMSYQQVNYRIRKGNLVAGPRGRRRRSATPDKLVKGRFDYRLVRTLCLVCGRDTVNHILYKGVQALKGTCTSCGEDIDYFTDDVRESLGITE